MTLDEIDEYATSLTGCKRKGHPVEWRGTSTTVWWSARTSPAR